MTVLEKYNIVFENAIINTPTGQKYSKEADDKNASIPLFNYFLYFFTDKDDVEDIIEDINFIITDGYYDDGYCRDIFMDNMRVMYTDTTAKFENKDGVLIKEIPLTDFKEILLLWKVFIQTPPLNNAPLSEEFPFLP
ncbi:hypothetical protein J2Y38_002268 [Flavobacterium sp. 2755]|uniref:hypothetical protein n=1 Tax=Flavobacterium sp. 2755 TaxID=2817765 RepID=UPI002855FBA1|nr:hypothetical protein [Flavobacterium sp. 2755]MDR6762057.1 hypothetical protein [Flavobacterium sp. 2755]